MTAKPLPIDEHLPRIVSTVRRARAAVVVAPPGAGKTTRVPPALVEDGPLILLQPRRIAARALASRIAAERGWQVGREVGWQVRHERRFGPGTRLLVATEGILTARLQSDPLLDGFRTVVLDEFHERTIHADLALALTRQAAEARGDLRIVVMSATLDAGPVARFLGDCPVIEVPGRLHPVRIDHRPDRSMEEVLLDGAESRAGTTLCFLPGAPEIARLADRVRDPLTRAGVELLPLHGSLDAADQDAALRPGDGPRVVLATNLAETSLTVPGVTRVIDDGRHKVLRYDPSIGLDRLEIERISTDSADQRAGRAGRTGPGEAVRLWDPRERLRPHREPEVRRVDLAAPALDVLAWGGDPRRFDWFEPPPAERLDDALELLARIGAVRDGRVTDLGRRLRRLPLHPRLARVWMAAGGGRDAARLCATLAEGWQPDEPLPTCLSDPVVCLDRWQRAPGRLRRAAADLERVGPDTDASAAVVDPGNDERLRRALLAGFPDRLARRREPGSASLLLSSGHGAELAAESGVRGAPYVLALSLIAGRRGPGSVARVRLASAVEREWIEPDDVRIEHVYDDAVGRVRAFRVERYDRVELGRAPVDPDPGRAAEMLGEVLATRFPDEAQAEWLRRAERAGVVVDVPRLIERACFGRRELPRFDPHEWIDPGDRRAIERAAPVRWRAPSGREVPLRYAEDGTVRAAIKLQELFGLEASPTIAGEPLTFELLAPNGRPVQTTSDLASFWRRTYPEVRRELRGRYPKHPWPEDPWNAEPTARTRRRRPRGG